MTSEVFINDKKVVNKELIKTAEKYFNNDSFWLVAPYKIFDSGTERRKIIREWFSREGMTKKNVTLIITYDSCIMVTPCHTNVITQVHQCVNECTL